MHLRNLFALVFIITASSLAFSQPNSHPETSDPGVRSEKTQIAYGYNKDDEGLYLIYEANNISEKSLFYEGKYDARKTKFNKENRLFDQIYIIPPKTLPIGRGKFIDQTEVANIHYDEFLFYMRQDSAQYTDRDYMPELDNKYKTKYFANPEFYFYPVTGVNIEHAEAFCQWRAKKMNVLLKEWLRGSPKKYRYSGRLPSLEEWKKIAGSASDHVKEKHYSLGGKEKGFLEEEIIANRFSPPSSSHIKKIEGYNANFLIEEGMGIEIEIPQYIYAFEPNKKGFFNTYGNVKELVKEGYAVGGSFLTPYKAEELFDPKDDIQAYQMDVGFRCVVEIARRKLR